MNQITYLVCHSLFCHFARCPEELKEKFSFNYEPKLNIFHTLGEKTLIHPPVMSHTEDKIQKQTDLFGHANQDSVSSIANELNPLVNTSIHKDEACMGRGDKFTSIITDCQFTFLEFVKEGYDYLNIIPPHLPAKVTNGKNPSVTYTNAIFPKYFCGLCVWKHMSMGMYWVNASSLCAVKNPNNLLEFTGYVKYLCVNHPVIWRNVNPDGRYSIDASKLQFFCLKVKN